MPDILTLFLVVLVALLVWAAVSPFEALGWWAGWFGDRVYYEPLPPEGMVRTTKPNPDAFVVFMSGVGRVSGQTLSRREQGFLQELAETLPNTVVIDDIFPYSVNSLPLTGQPFFASLWRWALRRKLSGHRLEGFAGMLINARNIFQVTMSADKRYGPIYNQAMAHVIIHGLTRYGYHPEDPRPVFLMGYSGAAQITMGAATYLKEWLAGPVVLDFPGRHLHQRPRRHGRGPHLPPLRIPGQIPPHRGHLLPGPLADLRLFFLESSQTVGQS